YVIHHLAWLSRGLETYAKQQRAAQWAPLPAIRYDEWPVGVMGLGQLGAHVARAVAALGYPVAGWARSPHTLQGVSTYAGDDQLGAFLARTRVLVNLLPLTPQTTGIIDAALLRQLRPEAVVINIARGAHVVDADLLAALDAGHVQAAVLDVFNQEPLPSDHPYWAHPRVRVTPHVAAATLEDDALRQNVERIDRLQRSEADRGVVNRATGYCNARARSRTQIPRPHDCADHDRPAPQSPQAGVLGKQNCRERDRINGLQRDDDARAAGLEHHQAGNQQKVRQRGAEDAQQGEPEPVEQPGLAQAAQPEGQGHQNHHQVFPACHLICRDVCGRPPVDEREQRERQPRRHRPGQAHGGLVAEVERGRDEHQTDGNQRQNYPFGRTHPF